MIDVKFLEDVNPSNPGVFFLKYSSLVIGILIESLAAYRVECSTIDL